MRINMTINDEILRNVAQKSMQNAELLMSDADLLKVEKRYQRAYALYQFSMEEVGKALSSVLLLTLIDQRPEDIEKYKKNFSKHQPKIKRSATLDTFICQVLYKGDYEGAMFFLKATISEDEKELDQNKNHSLYTDIIGNDVKAPREMIGEEKMNFICFKAITRYKMAQPFVNMILEHYEELRQYQKENGANRNMSIDSEEAAKEFWDEILSKD